MGSSIDSRVLVAVPYDQMVRNLFKHVSPGTDPLHAAVGICGEAGELVLAESIEDVVLELGDLEFYVEALYQAIGGRVQPGEELYVQEGHPAAHQVLGTVTTAISTTSCRLLDLVKKSWVYGAALDDRAVRFELMCIEVMMDRMRRLVGVRRPDVLAANQAKLGKRFPDGVYTDRDAQQRVDQSGEGGSD
jgi:hypothetical protein